MEYTKIVSASEANYKIAKGEKFNFIVSSSGGQSSYNLPKEFADYAIENGILVASPDFQYTRKTKDGDAYLLSDEYTLQLGKGVLWLIGSQYAQKENLFFVSKGYQNNKYQLFRASYKDQANPNCDWFVELYDKNLAGSELVIIVDSDAKKLVLDISLNAVESSVENNNIQGDWNCSQLDISDVEPRQIIYYGVPGTGKSNKITKKVGEVYPEYISNSATCEQVFRTTFHPEYSYYDFVGSIVPTVKSKNGTDEREISYEFTPGIFTQALCAALDNKNQNKPVYLILEEMSRANVAAIFGDLFQLLDRDEEGKSEYCIKNDLIANELKKRAGVEVENIYLPSNLFIYGSVNTSDQNVFVMDNAFKRRFEFEYVDTKPVRDEHGLLLNEYKFSLDGGKYQLYWNDFYQRFNSYVTKVLKLKEDKQIGQFFIKFKHSNNTKEVEEYNYRQICNKLLQYMWSDVHKSAMAKSQLFSGVENFEDAYSALSEHKNIFCQDFIVQFEAPTESDDMTKESTDGERNTQN